MVESEHKPEPAKDTGETQSTADQPSQCLLCGMAGPALSYGHWICDHCKNVVQAEALSRKRRIMKEGGGPG